MKQTLNKKRKSQLRNFDLRKMFILWASNQKNLHLLDDLMPQPEGINLDPKKFQVWPMEFEETEPKRSFFDGFFLGKSTFDDDFSRSLRIRLYVLRIRDFPEPILFDRDGLIRFLGDVIKR